MRGFILSVFLISASISVPAHADPAMPEPIQSLAYSGAQVRYLGQDGGLDGWVAFKDGQEQYFYVTPDGQSIILGLLFNNKGDIVTVRQMEALRRKEGSALDALTQKNAQKPVQQAQVENKNAENTKVSADKKTKSDELFLDVSSANIVQLGKSSAPAIYTFIDPQCPHCHDMIQSVRKSGLLEKGKLQIKLVPVGLMNETSLKMAAFLLAAPNAQELFFKHLDGDKNALNVKGDVNTQAVQKNIMVMQKWNLDVTPFSVYKDSKGKIKILRGVPEDLNKLIAELK